MRCALLLGALLAAACGGGGGGTAGAPFGLTQRTVVQGLTFPIGLPQPGQIAVVDAFPLLGFADPLYLAFAPDGTNRIFVVEQAGRIRVFPNDPGADTTTLFLDISAANGGDVVVGGERGLLGLAFHPNYAQNGFFYVAYFANNGAMRVARYQVTADPDVADPNSELILLEVAQPAANHNGGCMQFGPDGKLYVSFGDGGDQHDPAGHGQNLNTLLGSLLRLNDDGTIPNDNPFLGQGGRGEIWAYGFRNPWRFSFDRNTGDLWLGDVGQNTIEEVDVVTRGGNYGWDRWEGTRVHEGNPSQAGFVFPVHEYTRADGASVTGGYVYRGPSVPSLFGAYLFGDFVTGRVWAAVYDGSQVVSVTRLPDITNPSSFGEDEAGEVYVCSFDGSIYRFEEQVPPPAPSVPQTLSDTGLFANTPALVPAPGVIEYTLNAPFWSDGARKRRWIALPGFARITFDATGAWVFPVGTVIVKHFEILTPAGVRRLETRVLVNHDTGWQGYTYKWDPAQSDADLLPGAETEEITALDAGGGQTTFDWYFPSRTDCLVCHTNAAGRILGVRTRQLNRDFAYPAVTDNQLRSWNNIGLFRFDIGPHGQYGALTDPADGTGDTTERARSYLAANCAQCHRPGGPTPSDIDFRYGIPVAQMNLVSVVGTPVDNNGNPRIDPFSRATSDIWERLGRLDQWRMPPLASNRVDSDGRDATGAWIDAGAPD